MATKIYAVPSHHAARLRRHHTSIFDGGLLTRLTDAVFTWAERARSRRELRSLDDRMLQDVGISKYDVEREARKHFWQN